MTPELLTEKKSASILGLKPETLRRWRWSGEGPRFIRVGNRTIRYAVDDLAAFINEGRQDIFSSTAPITRAADADREIPSSSAGPV